MPFDAQTFDATLLYEATAPLVEIQADLRQVEAFDTQAEAELSVLRKEQTKWFIMGFISCFLAVFLIGIPFLIYAIVKGLGVNKLIKGIERRDVENRRYRLLQVVLPNLAIDMDPAAPIMVRADFAPTESDPKFQGKTKVGIWSVLTYVDPWLTLRGRFLDGTRFQLTLAEQRQVRTKHYRSRSGKYKSKTKRKVRSQASLRLRFKPKRYDHVGVLGASAREAVQLPAGVEVKRLEAQSGELHLRSQTKLQWSATLPGMEGESIGGQVDGVAWMSLKFLSLYQVLNLARRMTRHGAPRSAPGPSTAAPEQALVPLDCLDLFQNLVLAAFADGTLDPAEKAFLSKQAEQWEIGNAEIAAAVQRVVKGEVTEFYTPVAEPERLAAFQAIVRVLRVDGKLAPREQRVIQVLGGNMGVPLEAIQRALGA